MKKSMLIVLLVLVGLAGCKKNATLEEMPSKSKFSYSSYVIDNPEVTAEAGVGDLYFTFTQPGMAFKLPSLTVQITDFSGPGTYDSKDGLTVYASEGNDDSYWAHDYSLSDPTIHTQAKIVIKRADNYLTAELEGELMHAELIGNQLVRTYTPFKASTHQTLYRAQ